MWKNKISIFAILHRKSSLQKCRNKKCWHSKCDFSVKMSQLAELINMCFCPPIYTPKRIVATKKRLQPSVHSNRSMLCAASTNYLQNKNCTLLVYICCHIFHFQMEVRMMKQWFGVTKKKKRCAFSHPKLKLQIIALNHILLFVSPFRIQIENRFGK